MPYLHDAKPGMYRTAEPPGIYKCKNRNCNRRFSAYKIGKDNKKRCPHCNEIQA